MTATTLASDLAADLLSAADPVSLSLRAGIRPDDWQRKLLRSTSKRLLVNASRQSGKSLMAAMMVAHVSLYEPGSLSLLVSPSERQSAELFRWVRAIFRDLDWPVATATESALRLELTNGSRVVSLPAKEQTVRGFSAPSLIILDEASRIDDDLWTALKPMVAVSRGRIVACSTPYGTRGWWFECWRSTENWERYRITADQCSRISPEFLAEERRTLSHWEMAQEYFCSFEASSGSPQLVGLRALVCVRWIRADGPHVTRSTPHAYLREPNLPTTGFQPSSRTLSGLIVGLIGGFGLSYASSTFSLVD